MAEKEKKIRVHNRSKRAFTIPSATGKGKPREIQPNRSVDLEASTAEKYLKLYPRELIRYENLVSPEERKEKAALESENAALKAKLAALEAEKEGSDGEDVKQPGDSDGDPQANEEKSGKKKSGLSNILSNKKE